MRTPRATYRPGGALRYAGYLLAVLAVVVGVVTMHSITLGHRPTDVLVANTTGMAAAAVTDQVAAENHCLGACRGHESPNHEKHAAAAVCLAVFVAFGARLAQPTATKSNGRAGSPMHRVAMRALQGKQAVLLPPSLIRLCVLRT